MYSALAAARAKRLLGAAGVVAALSASALLAPASGANGAGGRTVMLTLGDKVHVRSTQFFCVVQRGGGQTGVDCVYGGLRQPRPRSYGPFLTLRVAGILRYQSVKSAQAVVLQTEPAARPSLFAIPSRKPQLWTLQAGDRLAIGGTDIACTIIHVSQRALKSAGLSCLPTDGTFNSIAQTWGFLMIGNTVSLVRYRDRNDHLASAITERQP